MILSAKVASKVKDSMSNARKIFRFLNFLGEIRKMRSTWKNNKQKLFKAFDLIMHSCSFFYYIFDNILWAINIGKLKYMEKNKKIIIIFLY